MIIYLCVKYESKTTLFSKDNGNPFSSKNKFDNRALTPTKISCIYWNSNLKFIFIIMYLCMKYELNKVVFSKHNEINEMKLFFKHNKC